MNDRNSYLGSGDAIDMMRGGHSALKLWRVKTGREEREDLTLAFKPQLGIFTEPFHLDWIFNVNPPLVAPTASDERQAHSRHAERDWMGATIDASCVAGEELAVVEVKHSSGKRSLDDLIDFYMPQLQHQLIVTGRKLCYFSVIQGNEEPTGAWIGYGEDYAAHYLKAADAFWKCVTTDTPPEIHVNPTVPAAVADAVPVNDLVRVDGDKSNRLKAVIADYADNISAAETFERAKKDLKKEMSARGAREIYSSALTAKLDKRGAMRITLNPGKAA